MSRSRDNEITTCSWSTVDACLECPGFAFPDGMLLVIPATREAVSATVTVSATR
jgi:hypothetical protein